MNRRAIVAAIVSMSATIAIVFASPHGEKRAIAAEAMRAIVVATDVDTKLVRQMSAELAAEGFDVIVMAASSAPQKSTIESMAQASGARAVVTVDEQGHVVRLWLAESPASTMIEVAKFGATGTSDDDDRVVSVRAAEALHAATIKLEKKLAALSSASSSASMSAITAASSSASPSSSTSTLPHAVAPVEVPKSPSSGFGFGIAFVTSPGGIGPMTDLSMSAFRRIGDAWSIGAFVHAPLGGPNLTGPEGSASAHVFMVGGDFGRTIGREGGDVHARISIGIAAASLSFSGNASSPYVSAFDSVWTAIPFVRGGFAYDVLPLSFRTDVTFGVAMPEPTASFAGREVAHWGRPLVIVTPSIAWMFP